MTFRNRHSLVSGFLCTIIFISGACALGGCVEITEPQGISSTDEGGRMPLTIRATVSDYIAIGEDGAPTTRIPDEDGYTTKFNDGDAIGIFAVRNLGASDAAIIDNINNLKLLYTTAANGSVTWVPQSGDTHEFYTYDSSNAITYVAYYPYQDGISISMTQSKEKIIQSLADNAKLQPAADQSTPAAYTGSDLMTAIATPTADPKDSEKKVLALAFEHRRGLIVFKPTEGFLRYVSPDGGFEYREEAREYLGSLATEATINSVKGCLMDDGSFRALFPVSASGDAFTPSGSYLLADGKKLLFTGPQLAAGTLRPGKCYTLETNSQLGTKKRGVQPGDFFYRDGKLLHREVSVIPDPTNCVGIVVMAGSGSDANYGGNCVNNTVHGHVLSVYDVATCKWGPNGDIGTNTPDSWNDWRGYQLTQKMKEDAEAKYGGLSPSNYAAAYYCLNWINDSRGKLTTSKTSSWYFPSEGYMYQWVILRWGNINGSLIRLVSAGYGQNIGTSKVYYWDASTLNNDGTARIVQINPNKMGFYSNRSSTTRRVRALLTF